MSYPKSRLISLVRRDAVTQKHRFTGYKDSEWLPLTKTAIKKKNSCVVYYVTLQVTNTIMRKNYDIFLFLDIRRQLRWRQARANTSTIRNDPLLNVL